MHPPPYVFYALPLALLFSSCGYAPLYAPLAGQPGAAQAARAAVQVGRVNMANPDLGVGERRVAQVVAQRLRLAFPGTAAADTLSVAISTDTATLAVQRSATVARAQIVLTGTVRLVAPDGTEKLATTIEAKASYNVEDSPFSTESGKTYAEKTAAQNLADEIARRVMLVYRATP